MQQTGEHGKDEGYDSGRAVFPGDREEREREGVLEQWGEPYFAMVHRLKEELQALTEEVKVLRAKCEDDSEEVRNRKMQSLTSRLSGKALNRSMLGWKQVCI